MAQELWLSEKQLPSLQQLETQFIARSGMEDAVSSGILVGRPYGGVSISWSPHLNHLISPLSNFQHKRVVGAELKAGEDRILLLCAYMPYYNSSRRAECLNETIDAITMLEATIENHPEHLIIIGGDLNCELTGQSPFDHLWSDFMSKFQLSSCDNFLPASSITYRHDTLDHRKWNDHFIVSKSLIDSNSLTNHQILDEGDNDSDHLPILMQLTSDFRAGTETQNPEQQKKSRRCWNKISEDEKLRYSLRLQDAVRSRPSGPTLHCQKTCRCVDQVCRESIQGEYDFLVDCIKSADSLLPRQNPGVEKPWWTDALTDVRNKSIDVHKLWIDQGRPRQGPTHEERLRVRAAYKRALRAAQRAPQQAAWDQLHFALADKDTNSFWKNWKRLYNKNKSHLAPVVNGCSSEADIANCFKDSFSSNSTPNNKDNVEKLQQRFTAAYDSYVAQHSSDCDCKPIYVSLPQVVDALLGMKSGKSADEDNISAEHLQHAPLNFLVRLTSLFNMMLRHAFVPKQFRFGFMVPIVKDQQGNHADVANYRGITISPLISKIFEHLLKIVFFESLTSSPYQYGFKKGSSTSHALHCLKQTINHYVDNGSRVFCAFLDASKAFDRVVHAGLFLKLIERKVPLVFLEILMVWYDGLFCRVKWGDQYSDWFPLTAGVRQGGVLSPDLYCIYVDELLSLLKQHRKGCYFFGIFAAASFYADDMAILAPSIRGLSSLLAICSAYCAEWDIGLNAKKSKAMYFGKRVEALHNISLDGKPIEWVEEWVYLGVSLKSGKSFGCSVTERIKKFYRCANAIFRIDGRGNDMAMLRLVETHCVPLLTYAIEIVHVANRDDRRQLRVAYNSLFRKIFKYRYRESVTALQEFLDRPTWEQLVEKRRSGFVDRLASTSGLSLAKAYSLYNYFV